MFPTAEQSDAMRQLSAQYGTPDRIMYEHTSEPYGIVWYRWHSGGDGDPVLAGGPADRNLFIKPDGTRLSWRLMV
jgi:hypothetical protein